MTTTTETQPPANAGVDSSPRCAVSLGSASAILSDLVDDPQDNGEYSLNVSGMSLALLWEAVEAQEAELRELRKDKARLDSGEIMHRCCGEPVDEIVCAKVEELLHANPAPMAEIEAWIKAHTQPDGEVVEMALCEAGRLMLRPNVLYRFTVRDGCKACADAAAPYSPNK